MAKNYTYAPARPISLSVGRKRASHRTIRLGGDVTTARDYTHANDKIDQGFESWATYLFIYLFIGHGVTLR